MGHVEISDDDDGFRSVLFLESFQVSPKCDIVTFPVLQPFKLFPGGGGVDVEQEELLKLQGEDPSFLTVFFLGHIFHDLDG